MNKEEQQQNLYQILLQRNQYNFDIIRKYRKKSNQYWKKFAQHHQQYTTNVHEGGVDRGNVAHVMEFVVHGRVDCLGGQVAVSEGVRQMSRNVVTDTDKMRASRGEVADKQILKLPSINTNAHNNTNQHRDSLICSTRRNLGIRTQISMSIINVKDKEAKVMTEINQDTTQAFNIKQSLTVPPSSAALPEPKPLLKPYQRTHHTQILSNNSNITLGNQNNNRSHHKRQSNASTSHKVLLNLQQIVFEIANSNPHNNPKKVSQSKSIASKYYNGSDEKQDGKESKKMRKYKQKKFKDKEKEKDRIDEKENVNLSYSCNQEGAKRLTSLQGLQNLANALGNNHGNNANVSSISLSALACSLAQKASTKTTTQQTLTHLPEPAQKPSKLTQILPHIRKIKQLRINLHKITRKDLPNSSANLNESINHNYSFSLNGITSNINTSNCTGGEGQMQITNKMFKIQSVPVHQIRWM